MKENLRRRSNENVGEEVRKREGEQNAENKK